MGVDRVECDRLNTYKLDYRSVYDLARVLFRLRYQILKR